MEPDEYLKMAEVEDRMWYYRALHGHFRRTLEQALDGRNRGENGGPPRVLDAGCGTGGLIVRLRSAHPGWNYTGADLMPVACEMARARCGADVEVREASITALPWADGSFDAVISGDVVCQTPAGAEAVAEFFRVLRPGGVVAINVPAYMWMWSYHDEAVHTQHRFTRREMRALLHDAGFEARRVTHWNALPFPLVWAKRKLFARASDTSDVKLYPAPVEAAFRGVMALEAAWLRTGANWAWGTSIFAVARKPAGTA